MDGLLSSCVKLAIIVCKLDLYQKKNCYVIFHTTIILVIPLYIGFISLEYSSSDCLPFCALQIEEVMVPQQADGSESRPLSALDKFRMNAKKALLAWTENAITK